MTGLNTSLFLALLRREGLPAPECEYRFSPPRKWRADYAWPAQLVALECEGGAWSNGRHTRGVGFVRDIEKYNRLAELGYRLVRCVPATLCDLRTIRLLKHILTVPAGSRDTER